jgi:hypothetical protein
MALRKPRVIAALVAAGCLVVSSRPGVLRGSGVQAISVLPESSEVVTADHTVPHISTVPATAGTAVPESYPLLLVRADDSQMRSGGVALAIDGDLPSNLVAPELLKPLLTRIWKQSRTFRRQCARIDAEARLLVHVYAATSFSQSGDRATTHIHRGATGLEAKVYLASRPSDLIELLAHEFEHIIEQLDGLDLPRLARLTPTTVWARGNQEFETQRAIHTGRLVAAEADGRAP